MSTRTQVPCTCSNICSQQSRIPRIARSKSEPQSPSMKDSPSARKRLLRKILECGDHRRRVNEALNSEILSLSLSLSLILISCGRVSRCADAHYAAIAEDRRIARGDCRGVAGVGRHVSRAQMDASPRRVSLSRALARLDFPPPP